MAKRRRRSRKGKVHCKIVRISGHTRKMCFNKKGRFTRAR